MTIQTSPMQMRAEQILEAAGCGPVVPLAAAAAFVGLSRYTLRSRIKGGELRAMKTREQTGGRYLVFRADLAALLAGE